MESQEIVQSPQPPRNVKSPQEWLRQNLFNTWYNVILTLASLGFILFVFNGILTWAFTEATWGVIPANLQLILIGSYPRDQIWRVWAIIYLLSVLLAMSAGIWGGIVRKFAIILGSVWLLCAILPFQLQLSTRGWFIGIVLSIVVFYFLTLNKSSWYRWIVIGWILSFPITMIVLRGFGENAVLTSNWGGVLLTLILAIVGIFASFPLGVFLALCRQSKLPAIRWISTTYIETVRGVPLITILFMGSVLIPIFMPDISIDQVVRMMIGITFFSAAYMAENVRGGLQAIPRGQHEAAQALGLNYPKTMFFIVLPQALRSVIPAIVGQFISLFKDTSLVSIIGLIDLLGVAKSITANREWLGLQAEVYLFAAVIYFVFSYSMSYISTEVETSLGVGNA